MTITTKRQPLNLDLSRTKSSLKQRYLNLHYFKQDKALPEVVASMDSQILNGTLIDVQRDTYIYIAVNIDF